MFFFLKMTLNEATLRKLGKEEIIKLALEYQSKFDSKISSSNVIKTNLYEMRKYYEKLESDIIETKQLNTKLCNPMKSLERQCWANEEYSRRDAWRYLVFQNLSLIKIWRGKFWAYLKKLMLKFILIIWRLAIW